MRPDPRRDPWLLGPPALALLLLVLVAVSGGNQALFYGINALGPATSETFWSMATVAGDTLTALALLLPFAWRWPRLAWAGILAGIAAFLISRGLKEVLDLPRPALVLDRSSFNIIGQTLRHHAFPSGHTTTAFTFAGIWVMALTSTRWRTLVLGGAILVGLSRIVVGAHWPMDVLAGILVGWLSAWVGWRWSEYWSWGERPTGRIGVRLVLAGCALALPVVDPLETLHHPLGRPLALAVAVLGLAWAAAEMAGVTPSRRGAAGRGIRVEQR